MPYYNGGHVISLFWPVQCTRVSTNSTGSTNVGCREHITVGTSTVASERQKYHSGGERGDQRSLRVCGQGGHTQVSEPSAQFSCENETSLENMLLKRKREKEPLGHSYLCSFEMKIPSKLLPFPAFLLLCHFY